MIEIDMRYCIEQCLACYRICHGSAMTHCLERGGEHPEPQHFRLMMACTEMGRSCAHILLLNSPLYRPACRACAEICAQCAHNCDRLGEMSERANACRHCAEACERLSRH
jgi:hypothetical protein